MIYALNLSEENRILSVTEDKYGSEGQPRVENLPDGDISNYLYINNDYVYSPLPESIVIEEPISLDKIEAQITYTAMMTNTLLP